MDWEQLEKVLSGRNLIKQEVEENIKGLEFLKSKVTYSSYMFTEKAVNGLIQDIKLIHAAFRRKAADNNLLDSEGFVSDAQELVIWYLSCYNRLDKVKSKVGLKTEDPERVLEAGPIGTVMHDTLYTL